MQSEARPTYPPLTRDQVLVTAGVLVAIAVTALDSTVVGGEGTTVSLSFSVTPGLLDLLESVGSPGREDEARPATGELDRQGCPDTGGCPGDPDDAPLDAHGSSETPL